MGKYTKTNPKFFKNIREVNEIKERRCTMCQEWFPETVEYFYMKNKSKPEKGFQTECKKCTSKRSLNYINNHWDGFIENVRKYIRNPKGKAAMKRNQIQQKENRKLYRKNNKDKMNGYAKTKRHKRHDINSAEWISCCEVFEWKCAYCGRTYEDNYQENHEQFHKEHVDNDGYLDLRNCVPACKNCNSVKHEMTLDELLEAKYIDNFTKERYDKIIWWTTEGYKNYIKEKPPYRFKRSRVYREDGTYYLQHELWSIDDKRNFLEILVTGATKQELNKYIEEHNIS